MANYFAQGAGNLDAVTWNTQANGLGTTVAWGDQLDTDSLDANGYAITINLDGWTRAALTTKAVTGGETGGFTVAINSAARNFAANVGDSTYDSLSTTLTTSGDGYALTITGNVYGGDDGDLGINPASMNAALLKIIGHVYGGEKANCYGIGRMDSSGKLEVTGNVTARSGPAIQSGYRQTTTVGGDVIAADGVPAFIAYSDYYTVSVGGSVVCSADGTWPFGTTTIASAKIKMTGTATGEGVKVRDASPTPVEKFLYVPDYPAEADVEDTVAFDYSAKTGSYPTTAATQAADAATLTGTTLDADGTDTTVTFGASNGTAATAAVYAAGQAAGGGGGGGPLVGASALVSC